MRRLLVALALMAFGAPSWAAIAFVQASNNNGAGAADPVNITVSAPTAGNFLVLGCSFRGDAANIVVSVTQTNVTWTKVSEFYTAGAIFTVTMWYAENVGASAGTTVTVDLTKSLKTVCGVVEYSGVATSSSFDTEFGTKNAASGTLPAPCITTTDCPTSGQQDQADELIVAVIGNRTNSAWVAPSNGYTERVDIQATAGSSNSVAMEEKIVSAAEEAYTTADDSTNASSSGIIARFKMASAGGTPVPKPSRMVTYE